MYRKFCFPNNPAKFMLINVFQKYNFLKRLKLPWCKHSQTSTRSNYAFTSSQLITSTSMKKFHCEPNRKMLFLDPELNSEIKIKVAVDYY